MARADRSRFVMNIALPVLRPHAMLDRIVLGKFEYDGLRMVYRDNRMKMVRHYRLAKPPMPRDPMERGIIPILRATTRWTLVSAIPCARRGH